MAVDYMAKRGPCQKKLECIVMGGCMFWSFSLSSDNQGWCVFTFFFPFFEKKLMPPLSSFLMLLKILEI